MAQSGYTPIQHYYSSTTTNVPLAANLIAGEIAINTADGKLFYKDSSNVVQVIATKASAISSVNNNGVVYVNSSGQATTGTALTFDGTNFATTGTATAAKLIPTGSSATGNGMYLPAANALGLSTNGTNAVYIDSSQNVGIGTSSPGAKLQVGDGTASTLSWVVGSSSGTGGGSHIAAKNGSTYIAALGNYSAVLGGAYNASPVMYFTGGLQFSDAGVERMRIDSSGNVGIGTSSPAAKLDVTGAASGVGFKVRGGGNSGINILDVADASGAGRVIVNPSGLLGVGVTTPAGRVDSLANGYAAFVARSSTSGAGQTVAALTSVDSTASNYAYASYDAYTHLFKVSTTEVVRIDAAGNLGVGTASPSGRLGVVGGSGQVGVYTQATNNHGVYSPTTGTGYGVLGSSTSASYGGLLGFDYAGNFGIVGYAGYGLYTNQTIYVAGTVYGSDRRLKENDQNITNALSKVMQLRAISFDWKENSARGIQKGGVVPDYGFIAQEVETIIPNMVYSTTSPARPVEITSPVSLEEQLGEHKGIDYSRFIPFLTAAIQEQQALITQLTDRIAALETK